MTTAERDLIAELTARIARLEARLAELEPPKPQVTVADLYPERADEK